MTEYYLLLRHAHISCAILTIALFVLRGGLMLAESPWQQNVLLRYLFRTGSVAMQELEWHLMAPVCMLGLSYAILKDGHVQVDIMYGRFPVRLRRFIDLISTILVVLVVGILLKLSLPYVMQSYSIGEKSPDPGGLTHRWILKAMLPAGFVLLLIQSVAAMLRALRLSAWVCTSSRSPSRSNQIGTT